MFPEINSFPGAGPVLAPPLLAAFGSQRYRYQSAAEIQQFSGIAPVLVRSGSAVVEWHCERSEGGWSFSGPRELTQQLKQLLAAPELGDDMGARGRAYVLDNYQWPDVLDRMEKDILAISPR